MDEAKQAVLQNIPGEARYRPEDVITIDRAMMPEQANEAMEIAWHDIRSSQIKQKILSGRMTGVEKISIGDGKSVHVAIADYNGYRVMVPLSEMNISMGGDANETRLVKAAANMIGSEIDFVVTNTDEKERAVSASRSKAMAKKMRDFYIDPASSTGKPVIQEGMVVEARVIGVAETVLRLEVFGAECFARSFDLMEEWIADARDRYYIGQVILVRIAGITISDDGKVKVEVEGKSLKEPVYRRCEKQGQYLGEVTGMNEGVYFLRLFIGANAVAHSHEACTRLPKKKDKVKFVCISWDENRHTASGIITRITEPYNR